MTIIKKGHPLQARGGIASQRIRSTRVRRLFRQARLNPFWDYPTTGFIIVPYGTNTVGNEAYKKFRDLLIEARKEADLTQHELASRLKRPQSFISKYERGERRLDVVEFGEVAKALGVDPVRFLRRFYREEI